MAEYKEQYIVSEPGQIDEARAYAARGTPVVCLDFLVERELARKNIPHTSLREVIDTETGEEQWWVLAQEVAREWYRLPAMKFFAYGGIRIAEVVEPIVVEAYLTRLFYFARVYAALKNKYPNTHFLIPALVREDAPDDDCLVSFEGRAVIDAARLVGLRSTILRTSGTSHPRRICTWKPLLVRAYNLFMGLIPGHGGKIRIYASEYWSHVGSIMEQMDDAELVLMDDGGELKHIPWRQLFAHRIRFRHPSAAVRGTERRAAVRTAEEFLDQWETARGEVAHYLTGLRAELDWTPVLEACEYLMTYAQNVVADIDALRRIMREEKPDIMLQLASVGGRHHHFFISARIAAELGIPSVELQHASAYIDPRAVYSRIETDYLATYGAAPSSWHERIGHAHNRLVAVGSPRFDQYLEDRAGAPERGKRAFLRLGLDPEHPVLLAAVPYPSTNLFHFDSYQLADFFTALRGAQDKIPGLQVLVKCRNDRLVDSAREYMREVFRTDCAATADEDIFALLCASDAAVCGNSTVIYQVLLAEKPLVLYPWKPYDTYRAQVYAPAAPLASRAEEAVRELARVFADASYREELLTRQKHFLEQYSFDGGATGRMVKLIRRLAHTR